MPIEIELWRINMDNVPNKITNSIINSESKLEDIIENDVSILGDNYVILGRQVRTDYNKLIDLLLLDKDGDLIVVELKKNKTSREVVAQCLDYASWVYNLSFQQIKEIYKTYNNDNPLEVEFEKVYGKSIPEELNLKHSILIVASEVDLETERIINYLSDLYLVPINIVFFRFFVENDNEYLSRSWLIDPKEVEEKVSKSKSNKNSEPWNGNDFVVNVRIENGISVWDDYKKYGFISAGGGEWYSRTLKGLHLGARIFAMTPGAGYLGVGYVTKTMTHLNDFKVMVNNQEIPITEIKLKNPDLKRLTDDIKKDEYFVGIRWIKTFNKEQAYWITGLSSNQNSAFRLTNKFTIDALTNHFKLDDITEEDSE